MFKILIIDPNEPFRRSLKKVLLGRFAFVVIDEAANGKEGIEKVNSFQPHLIFLEIHLPAETGLDFARRIKADDPDIIIVILASYDFPEYQAAAEDSGVARLIPKDDWTGEDMIAFVESIVSDFEMEDREYPEEGKPPWQSP
jgi:DNA-binding NarL/FixJ family response regulator